MRTHTAFHILCGVVWRDYRAQVTGGNPGLLRGRMDEGLDLQADGGTHVANTREVGKIRVAGYKSKDRINKRIELEICL